MKKRARPFFLQDSPKKGPGPFFRPKKHWGQHFLVNPRTLQRIAQAAQLTRDDLVLEIGAGAGQLTRFLAGAQCPVIAIEKDPALITRCREVVLGFPQVIVLEADILSVTLEELTRQHGWVDRPWVIVGNLPYSITSPILEWCVRQRRLIRRCIFTIQKEFSERMVAHPGTKDYGSLSVFVQYSFSPKILFTISRGQFYPRPDVDSTCLELIKRETPPIHVKDETHFSRFVQTTFAYRRKTLLNAVELATKLSRKVVLDVIQGLSLDPRARPETLTVLQLATLFNALTNSAPS